MSAFLDWLFGRTPVAEGEPRRRPPPAMQRAEIADEEWQGWHLEKTSDPDWAYVEVVQVAGTGHRRDAAVSFIEAATTAHEAGTEIRVEAVREPNNPADANAIRLVSRTGGARDHFGYVPREVAALIAKEFPAHMPLRVRLNRVRWARSQFAIYVDILRPAKRSAWWKANMKDRE